MAQITEKDEQEFVYKLQRSFKVSSRVYDQTFSVSPSLKSNALCDFHECDNVFHEFEAFEKLALAKHKSDKDCKEYFSAVESKLYLLDDQVLLSNEDYSVRVGNLKKMVIGRLRGVFKHVLIEDSEVLDANPLRDCAQLCMFMPKVSISSTSNDSEDLDEESSFDVGSDSTEDLYMNLVKTESIPVLMTIADRMIRAEYGKECCDTYISARCDALRKYLSVLGVGKIYWDSLSLDELMDKWTEAIEVFTRFVLFAEKQLCDQVFARSEQLRRLCFSKIATESAMQLLTFCKDILAEEQSPEKLFGILDMYKALAKSRSDLNWLFFNNSCDFVCTEAERLLEALGEAAKGAYIKFEIAVKRDSSCKVLYDAEIHPFLRASVEDIIKLVGDYGATLNFLLEGYESFSIQSLLWQRLFELISSLEANIQKKSKLYPDDAMKYIFLMNNIFYIVGEVKGSKLGELLGEDWVKERCQQVKKYGKSYLLASWSTALSFLRYEGLVRYGCSTEVDKEALKERFKDFNAEIEAIYKVQTGWSVPDPQLRDELRVSISENVILAYRSFMGRLQKYLEDEKYLKYTAEDLGDYLFDLFEGAPKRLRD